MSSASSFLKNFKKLIGPLKWILAISLLYFVVNSGKLDVKQLGIFIQKPQIALLGIAMIFNWYGLTYFRWRLLLKSQGIEIPFKLAFQLGMLGQFFMTFAPGTLGGDVAKGLYICRRYPSRKMRALSSVMVDRAIGLFAILSLGALSFLLGRSHISALDGALIPLLVTLGYLLCAILVVGMGVLLFMPKVAKFLAFLSARYPDFSYLRKHLSEARKVLQQYANKLPYLWGALGISFVCHSMAVGVLYLLANSMFGAPPWGDLEGSSFYLASILGLTAMALPIAPLGLGVGQVAFASVFLALGVTNEAFGAGIVTALQVLSLTVNLTGSIFFLTHKAEVAEIESLQEATSGEQL